MVEEPLLDGLLEGLAVGVGDGLVFVHYKMGIMLYNYYEEAPFLLIGRNVGERVNRSDRLC